MKDIKAVINESGQCYEYLHYGQLKKVSFDYAFDKAFKIIDELNSQGLNIALPMVGNKGTLTGWHDYMTASGEAEIFCKTWGVELQCLLTRELIGHEGAKLKVEYTNGKTEIFYCERFGRYAPYHIKRRKGAGLKAGGKRVTDKIKSIYVLEASKK